MVVGDAVSLLLEGLRVRVRRGTKLMQRLLVWRLML